MVDKSFILTCFLSIIGAFIMVIILCIVISCYNFLIDSNVPSLTSCQFQSSTMKINISSKQL